ncbi:MAG: hypothetical protein HRT88_09690 [Lentisphaeraceae bacterium]|nr:hypothetical protein [Lentisphaeraceae bacterium]
MKLKLCFDCGISLENNRMKRCETCKEIEKMAKRERSKLWGRKHRGPRFCSRCEEELLIPRVLMCEKCKEETKGEIHQKKIDYLRNYNEVNREKIKEQGREYYRKNAEDICSARKKERKENPEKFRKIQKDYRDQNREKIKEQGREYYRKNADTICKQKRAWRAVNQDKTQLWYRRWYKNVRTKPNRSTTRENEDAEMFFKTLQAAQNLKDIDTGE